MEDFSSMARGFFDGVVNYRDVPFDRSNTSVRNHQISLKTDQKNLRRKRERSTDTVLSVETSVININQEYAVKSFELQGKTSESSYKTDQRSPQLRSMTLVKETIGEVGINSGGRVVAEGGVPDERNQDTKIIATENRKYAHVSSIHTKQAKIKSKLERSPSFLVALGASVVEKRQKAFTDHDIDDVKLSNYLCGMSEVPLTVCFGGDLKEAQAPIDTSVGEELIGVNDISTELPRKTPCTKTSTSYHGEKRKHFSWCGHGKGWTCLTVFFAYTGFFLAMWSRASTRFVRLEYPFEVSPQYLPIYHMGMIRMEICLNATMMNDSACSILRLSSDAVDDLVFNLSRSLLFLAAALGFALCLFLSTSVFWESINLKPIGIGFLFTYFFQSFSMLFFDTDLCNEHTCRLGRGSILCIIASICWMLASVGTAKMDSFKLRAIRARRRAARKLAKQEKRALKALKKQIAMERMASRVSTASTESKSTDSGKLEELEADGFYTC